MKVFRINSKFRVLRLTFHWKSASKSWNRRIIIGFLIYIQSVWRQHLNFWILSVHTASFKISVSKVQDFGNFVLSLMPVAWATPHSEGMSTFFQHCTDCNSLSGSAQFAKTNEISGKEMLIFFGNYNLWPLNIYNGPSWLYYNVALWKIPLSRKGIDKLGVFQTNQISMCLDPHMN